MASADDQIEKEVMRWVNDFVDRVFQISQENLVSEGKIDTSTLLRSGNVNRTSDGAEIVYSASYASNVHDGRMWGSMPPVDPIERWVNRKLNIKGKEGRSTAWAIATAIKERGIQSTPFLQAALEKAAFEVKAELRG